MIRHILLIQFQEGIQPSDIEKIKKKFIAFSAEIEGVLSVEWGENNIPEKLNQNYTHCVLMTFKDEASRKTYLPHPRHDALKAVFLPFLNKSSTSLPCSHFGQFLI